MTVNTLTEFLWALTCEEGRRAAWHQGAAQQNKSPAVAADDSAHPSGINKLKTARRL